MFPRLSFVLPLIAVALLALSDPAQVDSQYSADQRIAKITYKAACRISKYACPTRGMPSVRRSAMIGESGARGVIWSGQKVVWLDKALVGTRVWLTIFHEQVHWLQIQSGVDAGLEERLLTCIMEREAMDFTNAYARELGAPQMQRSLVVWRNLYSCNLTTTRMM